MNKISWRTIIEVVGAVSIVASLIFVGLELQQAQSATSNDRAFARVEVENDWRAEINQHPAVWIKGNAGEELTPEERLIYENLIRSRWIEIEAIGISGVRLGSDLSTNRGVVSFSIFLHNNPAALTEWKRQMEADSDAREILTGQSSRRSIVIETIFSHLEELNARR